MPFAFHPSFALLPFGAWARPTSFGRGADTTAAVVALIAVVVLVGALIAQAGAVPRVAAATPSPVTAAEPLTPFAVASARAVHNRLVVTVTRTGAALPAGASLRVDGGTPYALPWLAAHEHATIALDDLVVQRRAPVRIEVLDADSRVLHSHTIVVAPDEPNDLGVDSIRSDGTGLLTARIVNHSPIPLHGDLVLAARMHPDGALLARMEVHLDVAAGGSQDVVVGDVGAVDAGRIQVGLATDAVDDADTSNDTYRPWRRGIESRRTAP